MSPTTAVKHSTREIIKIPRDLLKSLSPLHQDVAEFLVWRGLAIIIDADGETEVGPGFFFPGQNSDGSLDDRNPGGS